MERSLGCHIPSHKGEAVNESPSVVFNGGAISVANRTRRKNTFETALRAVPERGNVYERSPMEALDLLAGPRPSTLAIRHETWETATGPVICLFSLPGGATVEPEGRKMWRTTITQDHISTVNSSHLGL